jgi:hypothetical protein
MRWALGLALHQVNMTAGARGAALHGVGSAADTDRSCLFNRCSARSITISLVSRRCWLSLTTDTYSERDKFFLKLRVNPAIFSVNFRQFVY